MNRAPRRSKTEERVRRLRLEVFSDAGQFALGLGIEGDKGVIRKYAMPLTEMPRLQALHFRSRNRRKQSGAWLVTLRTTKVAPRKNDVLVLGQPRAPRWFNNLLPNLRTWVAAWEFRKGRIGPRYEFELEDFDYSTRIAEEGQQIFAFGAVKNVGLRPGSVYIRIIIYNPHHNWPPFEIWTNLIAVWPAQIVYDSQDNTHIDSLCETEIRQGESRGFACSIAVPRLPAGFDDDNLTYYTRIELWKPARRFKRSRRPLTVYQYQSSTHTRLQVLRSKYRYVIPPAKEIPTPSVFISYAWDGDEASISGIAAFFQRNGCRVWLDRSSQVGDTDIAIARAIENCDMVLVVLSPKYLQKWIAFEGGVGKERYHITEKMRRAGNSVLVLREPASELPAELAHCYVEDAARTAWRGRALGSLFNQMIILANRTESKGAG